MKRIFTLLLSLSLIQAFGQTSVLEVVSPAGGFFSVTGGISMSWTLGEPVIGTLTGGSMMITQGFQQGDLFNTDIIKPDLPTLTIKMYPNPAGDKVTIEVSNRDAKGEFIVELYDLTGRKVLTKEFGQFVSQVPVDLPVSSLKPGIYMVQTKIGNRVGKVLKLIKE